MMCIYLIYSMGLITGWRDHMGILGNWRSYSRRIVLCISCGPLLLFACISRSSASGPSFAVRSWGESSTSAQRLSSGIMPSKTNFPSIFLGISQQPFPFSAPPPIPPMISQQLLDPSPLMFPRTTPLYL